MRDYFQVWAKREAAEAKRVAEEAEAERVAEAAKAKRHAEEAEAKRLAEVMLQAKKEGPPKQHGIQYTVTNLTPSTDWLKNGGNAVTHAKQ